MKKREIQGGGNFRHPYLTPLVEVAVVEAEAGYSATGGNEGFGSDNEFEL